MFTHLIKIVSMTLFTYRWTRIGNSCLKAQQVKTRITLVPEFYQRITGIKRGQCFYSSCGYLWAIWIVYFQGALTCFKSRTPTLWFFSPPYSLLPKVLPFSAHAVQFQQLLNSVLWFRCSSRPSMCNTKHCWYSISTSVRKLHVKNSLRYLTSTEC